MDILTLIPAITAIFALTVFRQSNRYLCYGLIVLCILAELPAPMHISALGVTIVCLILAIMQDIKHHKQHLSPVTLKNKSSRN